VARGSVHRLTSVATDSESVAAAGRRRTEHPGKAPERQPLRQRGRPGNDPPTRVGGYLRGVRLAASADPNQSPRTTQKKKPTDHTDHAENRI